MAGLVPAIHVFRIARKQQDMDARDKPGMTGRGTCSPLHRCLVRLRSGAARCASAQDYPTRPVKIVVPFPAGGGTDALTRFVAKGMEQRLGQPFIIENRGGAGTTLGGTAVARAEPDGYTHHGRHHLDVRGRARALQAAGLRSDQGLLADHAVRDGAVRAGRAIPSLGVEHRQGAGRARQEQAGRIELSPPPASARCITSSASCS